MDKHGISVHDERNLVYVRKPLHWVLHTKQYYFIVNISVWAGDTFGGEEGVFFVLDCLSGVLGTKTK